MVKPEVPRGGGARHALSCLDKMVCPSSIINMHFFYDHPLDVDRLAASLARITSRYPFLAGRLKGYMSVSE